MYLPGAIFTLTRKVPLRNDVCPPAATAVAGAETIVVGGGAAAGAVAVGATTATAAGAFVASSVLRVGGFDRHDRRVGGQGERPRHQARQFRSAQTGHPRDQVQHCPIMAGYASEHVAGPGRGEQVGEFIGGQRPALVANVNFDVQPAHVPERTFRRAVGADQPVVISVESEDISALKRKTP